MYPHRIRLRGPWQATGLSQGSHSPITVRMPCRIDEVHLGFRGLVHLARSFGMPRQLDEYERIWLTFSGLTGEAEVSLNGEPMGRFSAAPHEIEITGRLRERNSIEVSLNCDEPDCGLWGDVALEIRCLAWLRNVTAELKNGRLCVAGDVIGHADAPLDLYVILERFTVIQSTVIPSKSGAPFVLTSDALAWNGSAESVSRVELMFGDTAWYTQDFVVNLLPSERPACPS